MFEEFEKFFSGGRSQTRGSSNKGQASRGNDITLNMEIDFMDAVNGV